MPMARVLLPVTVLLESHCICRYIPAVSPSDPSPWHCEVAVAYAYRR
jgi:hypothetical protein